MPFVRITLGQPVPAAELAALAHDIKSLMVSVLGKKGHLTAVLAEPSAGHWLIGDHKVASAAHIEANITAGTNTEGQKAEFIASAAARLRQTLPDLPLATYVIVREIAATDWGYDGQTQAARR